MNRGDVHPNDMHPDLTDSQLEQLLIGKIDRTLIDHPVAAVLTEGMETLRATSPASPSPALSEFVGVMSCPPTPIASPPAPIVDLRPRSARKRKQKMISSFAALVATTTGKLALGATVAAAAVGGAQVTGIVDVVPDFAATTEVVAAGPAADDTETPDTTSVEQEAPETSEPNEPVAPAISDVELGDADDDSDDFDEVSTLNQTVVYPVEGVGTVTIVATDGVLTMAAEANPGWTLVTDDDDDDDRDDDELAEARFSDGTRDVKVKAEIEHGAIRITVRENGEKVETYFDADGNPIDKPADSDHDEHDDDDESAHRDDGDDEADHHDDDDDDKSKDDEKSDHDDDDDDEADHRDDDDDDKSKDDDKSDHDDD